MQTVERDLNQEISEKKRILLKELQERSVWFVRLRWWVPPAIFACAAAARLAGVSFALSGLLLSAAFILAYNLVFYAWSRRLRQEGGIGIHSLQKFAYWQTGMDYLSMFLLIHFTGGVQSPLMFFFIFHIVFASILLPSRSAFAFSGLVVGGMVLIGLSEYLGWSTHHPLVIRNTAVLLAEKPYHMAVMLVFFSASVFITAFSTTSVTRVLRRRILDLGDLSEFVTVLNGKLSALFSIIQAIGSAQKLEQVMTIVTNELQRVMNVQGISVKLLSEDGRFLRFAAASGLPDDYSAGKQIDVDRSPLNRRILDGEPYVTGNLTDKEGFQFREALEAARIRSVLFVPLTVEGRVIGILGAYCVLPGRFGGDDVGFFRQAGELVAIAMENARAFESIERLTDERVWYMMRVAHNLKSPLSAMLGILEMILSGYLGGVEPSQRDYLERIEQRAQGMLAMIRELMTLSARRSGKVPLSCTAVDVGSLIERIRNTFHAEASEKGIGLEIDLAENLPKIEADAAMIEQALENLVSNALKYTRENGKVSVAAAGTQYTVRVEVSDTGIGIPKADLPNVFKEFFRAQNARDFRETGTGLGMAIVKDIVERHGGRILVESEEGFGTIVVVHLPISRAKAGAARKPLQDNNGKGTPPVDPSDCRERAGRDQTEPIPVSTSATTKAMEEE